MFRSSTGITMLQSSVGRVTSRLLLGVAMVMHMQITLSLDVCDSPSCICRGASVKAEPAQPAHTGYIAEPEDDDEDDDDDVMIADLAVSSAGKKATAKLSPINGAGRGYSHSRGACLMGTLLDRVPKVARYVNRGQSHTSQGYHCLSPVSLYP